MELVNLTPYSHHLFRGSLTGNTMIASVAIKVTYDINISGQAKVSENQVWKCSAEPYNSAYGPFESDDVFKRGGVDIMVLGKARPPKQMPTKRMEVRVHMPGKLDHSLLVMGNRTWKSGILGLSVSDPEPFTEMPLSIRESYGGSDEWDELAVPHPSNPLGKGFIWQKETAKGKALPNIEHPAKQIQKWNDRPAPVGFGPVRYCEERIKRAVKGDAKGQITSFDPVYFNNAFNDMIVQEVKPGEQLFIYGMSAEEKFSFTIPDHRLGVDLQFADQTHERTPIIEQLGIEVEHKRAFITYRYSFQYSLRSGEKRLITIKELCAP